MYSPEQLVQISIGRLCQSNKYKWNTPLDDAYWTTLIQFPSTDFGGGSDKRYFQIEYEVIFVGLAYLAI